MEEITTPFGTLFSVEKLLITTRRTRKQRRQKGCVSDYPSKTSGMRRRQPDMMNTAELRVLTVPVNIAVWTTGPRNATTDCIL